MNKTLEMSVGEFKCTSSPTGHMYIGYCIISEIEEKIYRGYSPARLVDSIKKEEKINFNYISLNKDLDFSEHFIIPINPINNIAYEELSKLIKEFNTTR